MSLSLKQFLLFMLLALPLLGLKPTKLRKEESSVNNKNDNINDNKVETESSQNVQQGHKGTKGDQGGKEHKGHKGDKEDKEDKEEKKVMLEEGGEGEGEGGFKLKEIDGGFVLVEEGKGLTNTHAKNNKNHDEDEDESQGEEGSEGKELESLWKEGKGVVLKGERVILVTKEEFEKEISEGGVEKVGKNGIFGFGKKSIVVFGRDKDEETEVKVTKLSFKKIEFALNNEKALIAIPNKPYEKLIKFLLKEYFGKECSQKDETFTCSSPPLKNLKSLEFCLEKNECFSLSIEKGIINEVKRNKVFTLNIINSHNDDIVFYPPLAKFLEVYAIKGEVVAVKSRGEEEQGVINEVSKKEDDEDVTENEKKSDKKVEKEEDEDEEEETDTTEQPVEKTSQNHLKISAMPELPQAPFNFPLLILIALYGLCLIVLLICLHLSNFHSQSLKILDNVLEFSIGGFVSSLFVSRIKMNRKQGYKATNLQEDGMLQEEPTLQEDAHLEKASILQQSDQFKIANLNEDKNKFMNPFSTAQNSQENGLDLHLNSTLPEKNQENQYKGVRDQGGVLWEGEAEGI